MSVSFNELELELELCEWKVFSNETAKELALKWKESQGELLITYISIYNSTMAWREKVEDEILTYIK